MTQQDVIERHRIGMQRGFEKHPDYESADLRRSRRLDRICTTDTVLEAKPDWDGTPGPRVRIAEWGIEPPPAWKLYKRLALQGYATGPTFAEAPWRPYCDAPRPISISATCHQWVRGCEVVLHAPCRKCDKCLGVRKALWQRRMVDEIKAAPRTWFIVLTFNELTYAYVKTASAARREPTETARLDRAAYALIQRYFKRLRKRTGRRFRYFAVFEQGAENGRGHYHVLLHEVDGPIASRSVEHCWPDFVYARLVRSTGAAAYCAKYLTKSRDIRPRASVRYGAVNVPNAPSQGPVGTPTTTPDDTPHTTPRTVRTGFVGDLDLQQEG